MSLPVTLDPAQTLGDLAATHPAATRVFLRHHLDFCCQGHRPLREACAEDGVDLERVLQDLAAHGAEEPPTRWDEEPVEAVIAHILQRYHEPLRGDLDAYLAAAEKVERVHREKPTCPRGLAEHLAHVRVAVRQHLDKEEQLLFPALLEGCRGAQVQMPVRVMLQEHDDHGADLRRTRALTGDFVAPPEACATWRALYDGLERLEGELMEHIHLENHVLFPRVVQG